MAAATTCWAPGPGPEGLSGSNGAAGHRGVFRYPGGRKPQRQGLYGPGRAFDGVDFFLTWHPAPENRTATPHLNANVCRTYKFKGITSHAGGVRNWAAAPGFLRDHGGGGQLPPGARDHEAGSTTLIWMWEPGSQRGPGPCGGALCGPGSLLPAGEGNRPPTGRCGPGSSLICGTKVTVNGNPAIPNTSTTRCWLRRPPRLPRHRGAKMG